MDVNSRRDSCQTEGQVAPRSTYNRKTVLNKIILIKLFKFVSPSLYYYSLLMYWSMILILFFPVNAGLLQNDFRSEQAQLWSVLVHTSNCRACMCEWMKTEWDDDDNIKTMRRDAVERTASRTHLLLMIIQMKMDEYNDIKPFKSHKWKVEIIN